MNERESNAANLLLQYIDDEPKEIQIDICAIDVVLREGENVSTRGEVCLGPKHLLSKLSFFFLPIYSLWCFTVDRNGEETMGYVDSAIIPRNKLFSTL